MILASIPSPSSSALEFGPLTLRAYGLMIAFGVVAGVLLAQKRWEQRGGSGDDVATVAMWAVPAGLIGARIYHVVTDWRFDEGWAEPFKIWEGGLGIPGGVAAGVIVGVWVMRRNGWNRSEFLDAAIPGVPLAQAIGRWGNWFNQELFGEPSDLPWAVEIDPVNAAERGYPDVETFHPTFLYESLWNLGLVVFLIWVDRTKRVRRGGLIAVYVVGYLVARLWLETVRIDHASEIAGVRVNIWMSAIGIAIAGGWLLLRGLRPDPGTSDDSDTSDDSGASDETGGGVVEDVEMTLPDDGVA
jgi:phosphatidylglycerol---prolipoprotein diacylglyceryl transferase